MKTMRSLPIADQDASWGRHKVRVDSRGVIRPWTHFVVLSAGLVCAYLLVLALPDRDLIETINLIGPLTLGAASLYTAWRVLKKEPLVVWTPFFWFLAAVVMYYALGPLVYVLGSDELVHYLSSSLPISVTDEDLLKTNLLNCVGILSIGIGVRLGWSFLPVVRKKPVAPGLELLRMKRLALWLLIIGGILQYGLILPWEFGAYDFVLSGFIYSLRNLFLFGLMALSYLVAKGERRWRYPLYLLWALQLLIAFIHFSKTEMMVTILLPVLGAYLAHKDLKRLVVWVLVMGVVYAAIAQVIHYGRHEVMQLSGTLNEASIGQRLSITERLLEEGTSEKRLFERGLAPWDTGWARLSYSNVQTFAMDQYDNGWGGDTLKTALYVLVPRLIWPEKPITTDMGVDFYEDVTGIRLPTHLGLGIFGEGYWNYGWLGTVLLGLVTGMVFWLVGVYAMGWMRAQQLEYMPSIFLGINMGLLGTTQFFANAIVGGGGFILAYALIVSKAFSLVLDRKTR